MVNIAIKVINFKGSIIKIISCNISRSIPYNGKMGPAVIDKSQQIGSIGLRALGVLFW